MRPLSFDAILRGNNGIEVPVYCELQPPHVGGQKLQIYLAIPAQNLRKTPPSSPCTLIGTSGSLAIEIDGLFWREFPMSSRTTLALEPVELFHIERLKIKHNHTSSSREIKFHLAPVSYLREEYNSQASGKSKSKELFTLNLPSFGTTRFIAEETIIRHPETEIPTATSIIGFSAAINLTNDTKTSPEQYETKFRTVLDVLSIFFRQAISLHGWTYTGDRTITTWINPLEQASAPCSREERGKYMIAPQIFPECASKLVQAYNDKDENIRALTRQLSVTLNPRIEKPAPYQILSMYRVLELIATEIYKQHKITEKKTSTDKELASLLKKLESEVSAQDHENTKEISKRLKGFINTVEKGTSFRKKIKTMSRRYPTIDIYCRDLWPLLGSKKLPGIREIRNLLAHGDHSSVRMETVIVAEWHLTIFLERLIFILLKTDVPDGIQPDSSWLKKSGGVYYQKNEWKQMQARGLR